MQVFRAIICNLATPVFAAAAERASTYKDEKFSDHAPLAIEYDLTL